MAAVAKLLKETEIAINVNVSESGAIPKGTLLQLADGFVGSASSSADQAFGGITKIEKIANDGNTQVAAFFGGVFRIVVGSAGATVGFNAALSGLNEVVNADANDIDEGLVVGKFLETGTSGQTVRVFVGKI